MAGIGAWLDGASRWVFATACWACGEALPGRGAWCARCRAAVVPSRAVEPVGALPVSAAWLYGGAVADAIVRCKAGGVLPDLAPIAPALAEAGRRLGRVDGGGCWVAVAPERARLQRRGFHLPDLVAALLSRHMGGRLAFALDRADASPLRNQGHDAVPRFQAHAGRGRRAILVDDVVTTGQTLAAAAGALEAAGWRVEGAVCIADARPWVVAAGLHADAATG